MPFSGGLPSARLNARPADGRSATRRRIFLAAALTVGIGLLVLPVLLADGRELLRTAAGISKDTVLLGMGSYFELWDAATYAAQEAEQMKGEMPDVFRDFSF